MISTMTQMRKAQENKTIPPRRRGYSGGMPPVFIGLFDRPKVSGLLNIGNWILRPPTVARGHAGSRFTVLGALLLLTAISQADEISLRNGTSLTGRVLMVQSSSYVFQDNASHGAPQNVPKNAVRYVLYADPTMAERAFGIRSALRHAEGEASLVRLLPTRPFGQAILDAVRNAQTSIWVSAYYISGSSTSPIKDFYTALEDKARQGIEVIVISEYGPGTTARVREATYNFARTLEQSGVRVLFMSGYRILHKKMILVDGQIAFLGSANLTMAGTLQSDEMNVEIRQPPFVARMRKDFEKIMAAALTADAANAKESK